MRRTVCTNASGSRVSTNTGMALMSATCIRMTALPSMTGIEARTPTSSSPSTAAPLEMTATVFPTEV